MEHYNLVSVQNWLNGGQYTWTGLSAMFFGDVLRLAVEKKPIPLEGMCYLESALADAYTVDT